VQCVAAQNDNTSPCRYIDKLGVGPILPLLHEIDAVAKLQRLDTSLYMLGWGGSITDAEITLTPLLRSRGENGVGAWNFGQASSAKLDESAEASSREADPAKREQLIKAALKVQQDQVLSLPLHRQVIPWAAGKNVDVVHRADNWVEFAWITVK
jgi:peptide/nickel transport system substrate-binding protein